jgi:required for meiotic nuclear division protein 1
MGSTGIIDETIILNEETVSIKEKLAFSNGLADSVKLGVLERMMDEHIDKVKNIPASLMSEKKVALSRKETLSLTGELLHFRAQLNLNSDLIDTPDIYWSEPKLEDLYLKISRVLETRRRTAILNKKLDYAKEMAQVLSEHLAEKHGLKLEWGIIALIAVEVAFETFHLIEKLI